MRPLLAGTGLVMIGFGVFSALGSPDLSAGRHALFLAGVVVAHDAVLMPLFLAAGMVVARAVPVPARAVTQGALIVTAAVTVFAFPLLTGFGRHRDLPSALPRDYPGGYALTIGAVWLCAAVLIVRAVRRDRRARAASV